MNKNIVVAVMVLVLCLLAACDRGGTSLSTAPAPAASPVEGVWRVAEITVTGANPSTTVDLPSVYIFTKSHYSIMRTVGNQPRVLFKAIDPESEEKIAAYDTFIANSGTYELSGTTMTTRPAIAKNPNFMGGGFDIYEVRRDGDILWLKGKSTDLRLRLGDGLVSPPDPADETQIKLIRIE